MFFWAPCQMLVILFFYRSSRPRFTPIQNTGRIINFLVKIQAFLMKNTLKDDLEIFLFHVFITFLSAAMVRFPVRAGMFLFVATSRHALGPTQPPIQWVLGVKRPGCEGDYSLPSSSEVKNAWSYTSILPYVFITWWLIKQKITFP
jgi:hypothetical protein